MLLDAAHVARAAQHVLDCADRSGECWIGHAKGDKDGYRSMCTAEGGQRVTVRSHRLVCAWVYGLAYKGDWKTRHTCDNPPCVRPDHLVPGTASDNQQDMIVRGRRYAEPMCAHGHQLDMQNTYLHNGHRHCRKCRVDAARRHRARHD